MRNTKPTENIDSYMRAIEPVARIDRDEERRLARIIRSNADEGEKQMARDTLACANLRLVVKIAHDYKGRGVGFDDLVAEGNIGLMSAVDRFDPDNGAKFSCYAAWWIKQAMRQALLWQSRTVRIPGGSARKLAGVYKARTRFHLDHGRYPETAELAQLLDTDAGSLGKLIHSDVIMVSMEEPLQDTPNITVGATLSDELPAAKWEWGAAIDSALSALSSLERLVVDSVFGIDRKAVTLQELAPDVGLAVPELQGTLDGALHKMRAFIEPSTAYSG